MSPSQGQPRAPPCRFQRPPCRSHHRPQFARTRQPSVRHRASWLPVVLSRKQERWLGELQRSSEVDGKTARQGGRDFTEVTPTRHGIKLLGCFASSSVAIVERVASPRRRQSQHPLTQSSQRRSQRRGRSCLVVALRGPLCSAAFELAQPGRDRDRLLSPGVSGSPHGSRPQPPAQPRPGLGPRSEQAWPQDLLALQE